MIDTVVVIPCFNEARRLSPAAYQDFVSSHPDAAFLFVDDGSRDGTGAVLEGLRGQDPERFDVLRLPENHGKAEAVRRGVLRAFERSPAYVGYWDADLSAPLEALGALRGVLKGNPDLLGVIGSRVKLLGHRIERDAARHYLGRLFATLADGFLRVGVYDTQCGAKLFRATPEVRGLFEQPFVSRWLFDVELLCRLKAKGLRPEAVLREWPLAEWRHAAGAKIGWRDGPRVLADLFRVCRRYGTMSFPTEKG